MERQRGRLNGGERFFSKKGFRHQGSGGLDDAWLWAFHASPKIPWVGVARSLPDPLCPPRDDAIHMLHATNTNTTPVMAPQFSLRTSSTTVTKYTPPDKAKKKKSCQT